MRSLKESLDEKAGIPQRYRKRPAKQAPVEASGNDTELAALYTKIACALTHEGFRAKQAAWVVAQLRERHATALALPPTVEMLREAFVLPGWDGLAISVSRNGSFSRTAQKRRQSPSKKGRP